MRCEFERWWETIGAGLKRRRRRGLDPILQPHVQIGRSKEGAYKSQWRREIGVGETLTGMRRNAQKTQCEKMGGLRRNLKWARRIWMGMTDFCRQGGTVSHWVLQAESLTLSIRADRMEGAVPTDIVEAGGREWVIWGRNKEKCSWVQEKSETYRHLETKTVPFLETSAGIHDNPFGSYVLASAGHHHLGGERSPAVFGLQAPISTLKTSGVLHSLFLLWMLWCRSGQSHRWQVPLHHWVPGPHWGQHLWRLYSEYLVPGTELIFLFRRSTSSNINLVWAFLHFFPINHFPCLVSLRFPLPPTYPTHPSVPLCSLHLIKFLTLYSWPVSPALLNQYFHTAFM